MTGPDPAHATFYRPAEVARMLRCSEWWVKEQARNRRIPYSWIGGSYLFTEEHIAEILRLFEVKPLEAQGSAVETAAPRRRRDVSTSDSATTDRLVARTPRRAREASASKPAAA